MYKLELKQGTFVYAPHSIIQRDPAVYEHPHSFEAGHFLSTGRIFRDVPAMVYSIGVKKPVKDIRVIITQGRRRESWHCERRPLGHSPLEMDLIRASGRVLSGVPSKWQSVVSLCAK